MAHIAGEEGIKRVLRMEFNTLLDIGSGDGWHADQFRAAGKNVTELDLNPRRPGVIDQPYEAFNIGSPMRFDCLWCCHCMEHQLNMNNFLTKMHNDLVPGGILAITVPPLKHEIVGGHVTLWNGGLILYNLVLARFDCSKAMVLRYGYNITVIVRRNEVKLPPLVYDASDITRLAAYFPPGLKEGFNGDIRELNWR
jgi:SAM-dependent methyltransferase